MKKSLHISIKKSIKFFILIILIFSITFLDINKDGNKLRDMQFEINQICNEAIKNVEKNEEIYLKHSEEEEEPLNRGVCFSALSSINTMKGNYDDAFEYSNKAIENYLRVEGGEYFAISEYKYTSWSMLEGGRFSESFEMAEKLMVLLRDGGQDVLNMEEITEIEAIIYSIFVDIYSELNLPDKAEIYYNKLNEIEITESLEDAVGDRVSYSKVIYAKYIKDYNLMKEHIEEYYQLIEKYDNPVELSAKNSTMDDMAYVNIKLGNYDEAFNQLKVAENHFNKLGKKPPLANTYNGYALYYISMGNKELAENYYDRAISIYKEIGNKYRLQSVLKDAIDSLDDSSLDKYYSEYYAINKEINSKEINVLLIKTINITENLNDSIIDQMENIRRNRWLIGIFLFTNVLILAGVIININKLIKQQDKNENLLNELAKRDYLTGTYTRSCGEMMIKELIDNRNSFCLSILDIDNFKKINDKYGHTFGDKVLIEVTKILNSKFNEDNYVIRFGGEEFIIVYKGFDKYKFKSIIEEVKSDIKSLELADGLVISFSAGICEYTNQKIEEIYEEADKLLYKAKENGRDMVLLRGE